MRLLVYEHVSGGGFANQAISASVLSEGFGMMRTLIADFKAAGHSVITTLDSRIAMLNPPIAADRIVPVFSSEEVSANLRKLSLEVDASYLIAPETESVLQSFLELVEQTGITSLNCQVAAIKKMSDKASFYEFIKKLGLSIPETLIFEVTADLKEITSTIRCNFNFPVIFKPLEGVSCCGISMVKTKEQMACAIDKIKMESSSKRFLIQEFIEGIATSVSLFSTGSKVIPISLNRQDVTIRTPEANSSYNGGLVPFDNPLKAEAFNVAERIVKLVPNLRGYVGIDFVLTKDSAVIIEINPRLTTSYIGLRGIFSFNLGEAILNAVLNRELPNYIQSFGYAYFSKFSTPSPKVNALNRTYKMDEVVSPPFPISENRTTSGLIVSNGTTVQEALSKFREAKKRFHSIIDRG